LEAVIQLEKYPKAAIDVFAVVLEADGSVLAGCINAASLALANGGIEMKDLVTAVTVGTSSMTEMLVDLTAGDEATVTGAMTIASLPSTNAIVQMSSLSGTVDLAEGQKMAELMGLALDANQRIRGTFCFRCGVLFFSNTFLPSLELCAAVLKSV
jgi:exosome complex component RRP41